MESYNLNFNHFPATDQAETFRIALVPMTIHYSMLSAL